MPGSTPNRGYPYPLVGESPAGHTQMQDLAMALDADVAGLGGWQTYTPTLSGGLTLGNGTLRGSYSVVAGTVQVQVDIQLGTTSVMGTARIDITVPLPPRAALVPLQGLAFDTSADTAHFLQGFMANNIYLFPWPDATGQPPPFSPTVPMPWAAGDVISVFATYEAA